MTNEQFEEKWKLHRPFLLEQQLVELHEAYLGRKETSERAAYIKAIRALIALLLYLEPPFTFDRGDEPALVWLYDFVRHLEDLDAGVVAPVFRRPAGTNRVPTAEWIEREKVVSAIELLHEAKKMGYRQAARCAIEGYRLHGVSEKEVESWRKEFQKGKVTNEEAVWQYEENSAWLRERVRERNTEELRHSVEMLHSEWEKIAKTASELPLLRRAWERKLKAALGPVPKRGE